MIYGFFHPGSGLGNQLHRYVATRVLAKDKELEFGIIGHKNFKGDSFMKIDMGGEVKLEVSHYDPFGRTMLNLSTRPEISSNLFNEKRVVDEFGNDIRGYDPEFNFVSDNTIIDGEFQDERYFGHRLDDIEEWLKVEDMDLSPDLCVIGFRGGEFYTDPDLGLPVSYYEDAINRMVLLNPATHFEVHTDDVETAKHFFPDYKVIHDIGINWRSMRFATNAIVSNSSFYILPRLLRHNRFPTSTITVAPRYWARHNTKVWALPQNYYKSFDYI